MIAARRGNVVRGKRIKVSWEEQSLRREGGMEIGERGCTSGRRGRDKEGDRDWKRGRRRGTLCSLQYETGRDNLLTVLLCYQQKRQ